MTEAEWALAALLDGEKRHDLYSQGFSEATIDRIWNAHQAIKNNPINNPAEPMRDSDVEDAHLFRLWIREASERPGRLAQAIADCVTPDEYREVLRGFSTATDIEDSLHSKQEEA